MKNLQFEVRKPNQTNLALSTNGKLSNYIQQAVWALEIENYENIYFLGGRAASDTASDNQLRVHRFVVV